MSKKRPTLAVFWGDTRTLLSKRERDSVLGLASLESITPSEVLLRDRKTDRLIVITSKDEPDLFCALCKTDEIKRKYGGTCTGIARCLLDDDLKDHLWDGKVKKKG